MSPDLQPVEREILHLVLVLLVECEPAVVCAFRAGGARVRVLVRTCRLRDAALAVSTWRPLVVVTMRGVDLGSPAIAALPRITGASLVITGSDVTADEAESVLASAAFEGWMVRQPSP